MRVITLDKSTYATIPGGVSVSTKKLKMMRPDLYGLKGLVNIWGWYEKRHIKEHLLYGATEPAIVMSKKPFVVAAYTEDIDCVALLKFPDEYAEMYNLDIKSRLISINTYGAEQTFQDDILPGQNCDNTWTSFSQYIVDFLTDDIDVLISHKEQMDNDLWEYVYNLVLEYQVRHPNTWRDGRPYFAAISAL